MKKLKKIFIIMTLSFFLTAIITPQKEKEVDAFAITGTALAIGTIATIIVGGTLVSEAVTETYGNEIIEHVTQTGQNISDFLNFNNRTNILNLMTSAVVLNAIRDVTHNKVTEIDELTTPSTFTGSQTITLGRRNHISGQVFTPLQLTNNNAAKQMLLNGTTGGLRITFTVAEPLPASVNIAFVTLRDAQNMNGTSVTLQRGFSGTYTGVVSGILSLSPQSHITDMNAIYLYTTLRGTEATNFNVTISNVSIQNAALSIPVDSIDQFGNVARGSEQIQDRINNQVQTGINYDFAIPTDVTTIRDLPSITTGRATADMDVPTEDVPSGIFAVVHNIWNLLRNIPSRVAAAFVGLFEYLGSFILSFMDMISSMFGSLMQQLGSIISNIWSAIGTVTTAVSNMGTNITNAIWNGVNSVLWNINGNITSFSANVRDLLINLPNAMSGLWEDAGLIWSGFGETLSNVGTDIKNLAASIPTAISNGIDNIRDFNAEMLTRLSSGIDSVRDNITAINMKITEVATGIGDRIGAIGTDITTGITSIVVPTDTDMDRVRENTDIMKSTFSQKFEFITVPIKSIGGLFLYPKSLYDVTFEMQGVEVHVLPESFRSSVNVVKPVLNGVIVLVTFIGIYKKIQGKEVI